MSPRGSTARTAAQRPRSRACRTPGLGRGPSNLPRGGQIWFREPFPRCGFLGFKVRVRFYVWLRVHSELIRNPALLQFWIRREGSREYTKKWTRQGFVCLQSRRARFPDRSSLALFDFFFIRLLVTDEFSESFQAK